MNSTTTPVVTPAGPAAPTTNSGLAEWLLTHPIVGTTLGPLAPPALGTGTLSTTQLAAQSMAASTVLGVVPQDLAVTSQLTLDQLIAIIRQRLAQLEAMALMTSEEVQHTMHTISAQRSGKPSLPRQLTPPTTPREVSVAGLIHRVAAGTPQAGVEFISLGDIFSGLLDVVVTAGGAALGGLIAGPAGAVMGGMVAHEWAQQQDF